MFVVGVVFVGVFFGCFVFVGNNIGVFGYWSDDCVKGRVIKILV